MYLSGILNKVTRASKSKLWTNIVIWCQRGFILGVLIYLIFRLNRIGWNAILGTLPSSLWFYVLSVFIFLVPVLCERLSYRVITQSSMPESLRVFSRKRVYNEAFISYAGEAYLIGKLASLSEFDHRKAIIAIKDNNLISAIMSNTWTIILIGLLIIFGRSDVLADIWAISPVLVGGFGLICILIYGAIVFCLERLTSLKGSILLKVSFIHIGKILSISALQILQWAFAMPTEVVTTWLIFLTVQVLLKRIPGLPNADLVFLGVALSLAGFSQGTTQQVAAMLVASTAALQIIYLAVFILTLTPSPQRRLVK